MKVVLFLFCLFTPLFANDSQFSLDYIYVNANTGQSSGGHSAIRLGELVYHFQYYPDKIFHIIREPWKEFRYMYGIQENRTIYIRKVKLTGENFNFFLDRMNEIYLMQVKELDNLQKLENDTKILESIVFGDSSIHLKAGGYFLNRSSGQGNYKNLNQKIIAGLGKNFLLKNLHLNRKKLYNFPFSLKKPLVVNFKKNQYPGSVENFSSEYLELLSLQKAYEVLYEQFDLNPGSFFEFKPGSNFELGESQLMQLSMFAQNMEEEILHLLPSGSNNKGYPLLVLIARYLVVQKSIEAKKLFFLDSFGKNHSLVIGEVIQNKSFLTDINKQVSEKISRDFTKLFHQKILSEKEYTVLEDAVNRQREILNGLNRSEPIRINYELMIPSKVENTPIHFKQSSKDSLIAVLDRTITNKDQYEFSLQKKYSFNLFNKNCTTEIFHSLNSFFEERDKESIEKLGGIVRGDDFLVFVPVYAYYVVGNKYRVFKEQNIPSLRTLILEKDSSKGFLHSIKESTTITSGSYKFNKEDSFFIFFTDDVFWQRPFYGIANLVSGVGEVGLGIGLLPFDKGERFVKGIQGIFFSTPEIFFFNIRKGTFIYEGKPDWIEQE